MGNPSTAAVTSNRRYWPRSRKRAAAAAGGGARGGAPPPPVWSWEDLLSPAPDHAAEVGCGRTSPRRGEGDGHHQVTHVALPGHGPNVGWASAAHITFDG